jgi:outer membrane lipoprotein-sorting protein
MFALEAAYDGNTLYMYSEDTEELTLSTPSEEELLQTTPFLYAQALLPICQYAEKVVGDKTQITLTPNDQSAGITKFVLRVVTTSLLPTTVEIHEDASKTTTIRFNNARFTDENPSFILEKEGAFINDLR